MPYIQSDTSPHVPAKLDVGIFRKIVSYLVIITLTFSPLSAYPSSPAKTIDQDYKTALSSLDEFMSLITQMRSQIDRSQFETEALLEKLDFDAENIVKFVTEDIFFEQYPGLLRGVEGTLMSRAGNALDQSVLLASLLNDAGFEARIARSTLDVHQAKDLLKAMKQVRKVSKSLSDNKILKSTLIKMAILAGASEKNATKLANKSLAKPDFKLSPMYQEAQNDTRFILDQLSNAGIKLGSAGLEEALVTEARDYFWVEYRLGENNNRIQAHPALGIVGKDMGELTVNETFSEKVPQSLLHRFRFQVFIEQKLGNKLTIQPLMEAWEKPVSNLIGKRITYRNSPDAVKKLDDFHDVRSVAKNTKFLIPVFTVGQKSAAKPSVFDLNGTVIDQSVLQADSFGASGLFQTLGNKTESALSGLTSPGFENKESFRALSSQWIELTLIEPGGKERKFKRYIIDRLGEENRLSGSAELNKFVKREEAIWKLAASRSFMLSPGIYPESYVLDKYLERLANNKPVFELYIHDSFYPDAPDKVTEKHLNNIEDVPELLLAYSFDQGIETNPGNVNYHSEPLLISMTNGIAYSETEIHETVAVDIISNGRRTLDLNSGGVKVMPKAAVFSGAWETRVEQNNFLGPEYKKSAHWNTRKIISEARNNGIPIKTIDSGDFEALNSLKAYPLESIMAMKRDLGNGFSLIVPERMEGGLSLAGWWRVDPQSGQTLGMLEDGTGANKTEYVTLLFRASLVVGGVLAVVGGVQCLIQNKCTGAGCLAKAGMGFVLGFLLSFVASVLLVKLSPETAIGGGVLISSKGPVAALAITGDIMLGAMDVAGKGISQALPECGGLAPKPGLAPQLRPPLPAPDG